jgi:glucokinase
VVITTNKKRIMDKPYVAGIDIGGQTTKIGIVDARGTVLTQTTIRTDTHTDVNLYIEELGNALVSLCERIGGISKIRGIGVGAPNGNYYTGVIENAVNLTWAGSKAIHFAKLLRDKTGIPVTLTNDANAAAVGEMTYGAAKGMKDFIMITTAVKRNGRHCNCGRTGCLETYTSATGVARTAREWLEMSDEPSSLRNITESLTSKDVFEAAKDGDKLALKVFEYTGKLLGESFADFIAFSAPEAIILFGGLARSGDLLLKPIMEHMNTNLISIWKNKIQVLFSQLKESDAAILGASALGWSSK